jgi:hypothetical protein
MLSIHNDSCSKPSGQVWGVLKQGLIEIAGVNLLATDIDHDFSETFR